MLKLEIGHEVVIEEDRKVHFGFEIEYVLELEHSLASLSKWEEIWEKPFLSDEKNTQEEMLSYVECMVVTKDPPKDFIIKLTQDNVNAVVEYINKKMTATWFSDAHMKPKKSNEKITAELVYYWLSNIPSMPPEFEHWHLNKLFTFIKIHDVKNQPTTRQNTRSAAAARRELMQKRRELYGSRG